MGFLWFFFQTCWETLKEDIMAVFREFNGKRRFEKSINATFISLIPKIASVVDIQDFHLVNLVGVVF